MKQIAFWIFILILVFILVEYYKGTSAVAGTVGSFLDKTFLFLQGRDSAGNPTPYPGQN